ncbi:SusC/RagA family TonB-linked outer membrane protein [Adhaeribacter aquaticus]|uniref:SusC/RagA family TonB-linked outer membrane protein n=1 Tax=Adhaeribacter aquaticus TaxID=299567 RepID=UPI0003F6E967|nr:SusC/RagA family TonB-linked outer membrane protein [Adhaeribacter aquaticus]
MQNFTHKLQKAVLGMSLLSAFTVATEAVAAPKGANNVTHNAVARRINSNLLLDWRLTGRVVSNKGEALPGVTVLVKGTTNGATTDANGNFTLNVPERAGSLVFSYIGYTTQERPYSGAGTINITLADDSKALEEVVVTALGIKKEARKLGYSTATVSTENLTAQRTTNVGNALVGKVAGLQVQAPPSGPGGSSKIRIRGQATFGGNNSPLIVVNGVPINNTPAGGGNQAGGDAWSGRSDQGDGLQSINPDDIEAMTVLKGAAASVLYGSRALNGVILITTKSGRGQNGMGVELNSNFQADQALDYTDFQYEYGQGRNGKKPTSVADARSSGVWSFGSKLDGSPTPQVDGQTHPYQAYPNRVKDFYRTGTTSTNSVAVSGGNEKGNFRLSFANTDANAIIPNSDYHRKILNLGLTYNLTEKLSTQLNFNYSNEFNHNPTQLSVQDHNINSTLYTMANSIDINWLRDNYTDPAADDTELIISAFRNRTNPYFTINKRFENIKRDRLFGNASLRYQILPWMFIQGRAGMDYFSRNTEVNNPRGSGGLPIPSGNVFNGRYFQGINTFREQNYDFMIGANREFGSFGIDATFGGNTMDQRNETLGTGVENFYIRDLYTIGNGQNKVPTYDFSRIMINSLYGTVDLSLNNYLFLNLSARNDWYSTLNPKSNSYLYPGVSTSFIFSQAFSSLPTWLNYGKLRAGYAEVGQGTGAYANALYYSLNANTFNGLPIGNFNTNVAPNPNLRPLKVKELEVGIELKTLDNRVNLDLSAYRKNTVDEILNIDITNTSGFSQTRVNVGKLRNQGVEMLLTLVPVRSENFNWESAFNFTYNKSEVLQLAQGQTGIQVGTGEFIGAVWHEVGKPLASLRGVDYRRDAQGRIITIGGQFQAGNTITYGSAIPTHTGGWLNTFTYKGIRLFTQIDFKAGHKLISNSNFNWNRHGLLKSTLVGRETGVVFDGVNTDGSPNTTAVEADAFYQLYRGRNLSTPFVYNASFVRWRTLSLGYDFSRFVNKTFIKGLNVNAFINNVMLIKKYTPNIDPETQYSTSDALTGLEAHALPTTRSYGLNVNIKL